MLCAVGHKEITVLWDLLSMLNTNYHSSFFILNHDNKKRALEQVAHGLHGNKRLLWHPSLGGTPSYENPRTQLSCYAHTYLRMYNHVQSHICKHIDVICIHTYSFLSLSLHSIHFCICVILLWPRQPDAGVSCSTRCLLEAEAMTWPMPPPSCRSFWRLPNRWSALVPFAPSTRHLERGSCGEEVLGSCDGPKGKVSSCEDFVWHF